MKTNEASSFQGILLTLAAVMPVMAIVSLVPVLPALQKEFASVQGSEFLVPMALTIPALCLAIFSPAAGWVADKIGRKSLLVSALFLYAIVGVTPYFLTDLKQIIVARFALGVVEAAIMTVATTLIGDYFKGPAREKWIGIQVASVSLAAIVLVYIAGVLGGVYGSRGPFLLYLFGIPLSLICLFVLFEPTTDESEKQSEKVVFPFKRVLPLALGGFVFGNLFYIMIVKTGAILAMVSDITPQLIGQVAALANAVMMCGTILFGFLKGRMNAPSIITLGAGLIALAYFTIASSSSLVMSAIGCCLVSLGSGIMLPTFINWLMSFLSIEVRGRGIGMWQGAFFLGQFIAPIVIVAISKGVGGLGSALFVASGVALVFCLVMATKIKGHQTLQTHQA